METEKQITQISVEDLTAILKGHQYFRVRYFAQKHNDYIERIGLVDDKMRLWEDSKEEICFTYFDLKQRRLIYVSLIIKQICDSLGNLISYVLYRAEKYVSKVISTNY